MFCIIITLYTCKNETSLEANNKYGFNRIMDNYNTY